MGRNKKEIQGSRPVTAASCEPTRKMRFHARPSRRPVPLARSSVPPVCPTRPWGPWDGGGVTCISHQLIFQEILGPYSPYMQFLQGDTSPYDPKIYFPAENIDRTVRI